MAILGRNDVDSVSIIRDLFKTMIPSKSACCSECVQPTFIDPAFGGGKAYNACGNIFCKCHSPSQPKETLQSKCCKSTMSTSCADEGTCCYICDECQKPCDWISDFDKFIAASQPAENDYSKHDHGHCWESKNPPCGQKIKHFECCLCQESHPEIQKAKSEGIEQGRREEREKFTRELIDKRKNLVIDTNSQGNCNPRCHDSGKDDLITSLLAFLAQ